MHDVHQLFIICRNNFDKMYRFLIGEKQLELLFIVYYIAPILVSRRFVLCYSYASG